MAERREETTPQVDPEDKQQQVLLQQQAEDSDDEFVPESEQVIDANDLSNASAALNLDLSKAKQKIWMVRIPRFLAERWRDPAQLRGQSLGKIKIEEGVKAPRMKLELDPTPDNQDIPHNYDLNLTKSTVENEYVFTERNITFDKSEEDEAKTELDAQVTKSKQELKPLDAKEEARLRRKRRFNRYKNRDGTNKTIPYVKTIPKKTAIVGTICHECQVIPSLNDPNYSKIVAKRKQMLKEPPKSAVTLLTEIPGVTFSNAGLSLRADTSKFLKSSTSNKPKSEGRATRMPQKDLFDMLFKLFDEYDYWSLKGLKERTKQPEAFLKETLEQIAVLIKKGPYALKYGLKREYKELKEQERAERLGELNKNDEDDEEENDEDIEMEDINI